jgi:hypothetical protein
MIAREAALLVASVMVVWLASAAPVVLAAGPEGLAVSALAGLVCLGPALMTLAIGLWSFDRGMRWRLVAILGGPGLRMIVVLLVAILLLALTRWLAQHRTLFAVLLVLYYLVTVATETTIFVRHLRRRRPETP